MNNKETSLYWTDERVNRLKELHSLGWSASQIARDLGGVTRSAVSGKAYRLELPARLKPAETNKPMPRLKSSGRGIRARALRPMAVPAAPKPRPADAAPIPAEAFCALPNTQPVPFTERRWNGCRWPIGDDDAFLCCNADRDPEHPSYCLAHRRMSGQRGLRKAEAAVNDDARRFGKFQFGRAA